MGSFSTLTLATAQGLLAARLSDPNMVRWVQAELTSYLTEALRTWQALTGSTRGSATFTATNAVTFYDIPTVMKSVRGYHVLATQLLTDLEYALLEPPTTNWATWAGTPQFTLADLTTAVQQRRDRFLAETGAVLIHSLLPLAPPPPSGRFPLADGTLAINRLSWKDALSGVVTPLLRDDEWGLNAYNAEWPQSATTPPAVYSVSATPPLTVQLAPPPLATGVVYALRVLAGAPVVPTNATLTLGIPDDWVWVVKWGALADLLSTDGLSLDSERAAYCEARWQQGLALAKVAPCVLTAKINNQPAQIDLLANADLYSASWQATPGVPTTVLLAGQTSIALSPPVSTGNYSVEVDLIPNMPVPVLQTDYIQVGMDTFDLLLDYAQHVALFKEGAGQIAASQGLLTRFLEAAQLATKHRLRWKPGRGVPEVQPPPAAWAAGTVSDSVGVV